MHFQGRGDVAVRFALMNETNHTKVVALEQPGDHIDLSIPDTDESAPDRKLRELLADERFGAVDVDEAAPAPDDRRDLGAGRVVVLDGQVAARGEQARREVHERHDDDEAVRPPEQRRRRLVAQDLGGQVVGQRDVRRIGDHGGHAAAKPWQQVGIRGVAVMDLDRGVARVRAGGGVAA